MSKFLFIVFIILKANGTFSQDHSNSPSLQEIPLYNTLYGTDCSIPKGVQFVHYPMAHPVQFFMTHFWKNLFRSGKTINDFVNYEIAYSSFHFIQLIKQYPASVVFDEMLIGREETILYKNFRDQYMTYNIPIAQRVFPDIYKFDDLIDSLWKIKNGESYEQLGPKEINILSRSTGGITAYILSLLNHLYPVTFLPHSEFEEIYFGSNGVDSLFDDRKDLVNHLISLTNRFNAFDPSPLVSSFVSFKQFNTLSDNKIKKGKIKQDFYVYYQKLIQLFRKFSYYMIQWREQALFDFVFSEVEKRRLLNKPIIIAFGAAHDFADNFAGKSFYTLPLSCTLPSDSLGLLLEIAVIRYLTEESEFNRKILRQYIEQQWNRMNHDQKNEANQTYKNYAGSAVFVPLSEIVKRILKGESVSNDEKNFEFVFNAFIKMSSEEMEKFKDNRFF